MSFRITGTSGDAGLEAEASSPGALFSDMATGLYALSCGAVSPETARRVSVSADTPESLLVNFLNELIYLMDTEGFVAAGVKAEVVLSGACRADAELRGENGAFGRHPRGILVKAATYHEILVGGRDGRWRAKVVLDI